MANNQHVKILAQGVESWNAWLADHPDVRPDFDGADLAGAHLVRAHLAGALLKKANLEGANLRGALLLRANLREAFLAHANLEEAILAGADLRGVNFRRANLRGAHLREANLRGAILEGADLAETHLRDANLAGALLKEANLEGVPKKGVLRIPLQKKVLARDLGHLLNSLADLYSVAREIGGVRRKELVAQRISVGTPNLVELIGILPQIVAVAGALLAVLKAPKALGESAKYIAEARKIWFEGTLVKNQLMGPPKLENQHEEIIEVMTLDRKQQERIGRIESSFNSLAQARDVVSASAEPAVWVEGSEGLGKKRGGAAKTNNE